MSTPSSNPFADSSIPDPGQPRAVAITDHVPVKLSTTAANYLAWKTVLVSSEIQQHLNQISREMNVDDEPAAAYSQHCSSVVDDFDFLTNSYHATGGGSFPSSSSTSSSFRSASLSCSQEISSTAAPATGLQFPEVSSLVALAPGVVIPYDDQYVANLHETPAAMAPGGMSTSVSAFRSYELHLAPLRRLTKPACGQRMFKRAMSVLAKMHTGMRYNHQQQQQQASAAEPSGDKLLHMISERKRREKLNDSFHALKAVLPPGSKKLDKTSMLIIAREYVNSLKSKVRELEDKNQALQSQLARRATGSEEEEAGAGEKVEIQITRSAVTEHDQTGEVCTVHISTTPARSSTTDVVLRTLQCLKEQIGEDVSLVCMSTDDRPHRANLTLHLKLASGVRWEEEAVRKSVEKALMIGRDGDSTMATCRSGPQ
ncbi:putative transcription factor bHLH041 [Lolium rigidum]|uniref:putative transcription factor bHLH041 n=1 Tax=Lolium rigidum TaxID=89674 RepID=UPI001F5CCB79|nr:putative transcription factor bHLH041 [Lolium rigidum]